MPLQSGLKFLLDKYYSPSKSVHLYQSNLIKIINVTGAVLANRLSEINDWNILLLEAGGDGGDIYDIPVLAANLQLTNIDWQYKTESNDSFCRGK